MKRFFLVLTFIFIQFICPGATIDLMTFAGYSGGSYSASDLQLNLAAPTYSYYMSDGSSWNGGAGTFYTPSVTYETSVVSNEYVYYYFTPLDNGVLYQQTDSDGNHVTQGTLGWSGDVVLAAEIGSTEATFSGYTTILDNTMPPLIGYNLDYYGASVGQSVYFQMSFTIWNPANMTWQPDTFASSFDYASGGYVDFTQVVPEPNVSILLLVGAGFVLVMVNHRKVGVSNRCKSLQATRDGVFSLSRSRWLADEPAGRFSSASRTTSSARTYIA
jgi:hypothetical protein